MSRLYEMGLEVKAFDPNKQDDIIEAANDQWPFEDHNWSDGETLAGHGESNLGGGEMDSEFAKRLTKAVFEANGGPCKVTVHATCMENLPFETFEFDKDNPPGE